jgi:hypothetical protein
MTGRRIWPCWEDWQSGWTIVDGRLHLEDEDVEHLLPPHLPVEQNPLSPRFAPGAPWINGKQEPDDHEWVLRFPFENGWEGICYAEYGVALNTAGVCGVHRRVVGSGLWVPYPQNEDRGIFWPADEEDACPDTAWMTDETLGELTWDELQNPQGLDDPDQLAAYLALIASFPSDPDARRVVS